MCHPLNLGDTIRCFDHQVVRADPRHLANDCVVRLERSGEDEVERRREDARVEFGLRRVRGGKGGAEGRIEIPAEIEDVDLYFRIRVPRLQETSALAQGGKEAKTNLGIPHDGRSGVGIGAGSPGRRIVDWELVLGYIVLVEREECDLAAVGGPPGGRVGGEDLRDSVSDDLARRRASSPPPRTPSQVRR